MQIDPAALIERFVKYIHINTQSDDRQKSCPSTPGQLRLASCLVHELTALGLTDVNLDENGYVMATLPANGCPNAPVLGLISHMDTSADAEGGPLHPQLIKNYDGRTLLLNDKAHIQLSPREFPELLDYCGQDLLVTDGLTLLGADDKAGICAIVSAAEYLLAHPEVPHGKIRLAFTPDEEIGRSSDLFDVQAFGADFAYTLDGDAIGSLEYENFNAANAGVLIRGRSTHTGTAKGRMRNAITIAAEWQQLLPAAECPECTDGYEGFYHIHKIEGDVERVLLHMLLRDHDRGRLEQRKAYLHCMARRLNEKYGENTVQILIRDRYSNMREKIEPVMYIVDLAKEAMRAAGVEPVCKPIRGGTDGARLSFRGLPCPNLFTGGLNFHSRYEFLPVPSLQKACETVIHLARLVGQQQIR